MSQSFLSSFNCKESVQSLKLKENDITSFNIPPSNNFEHSKIVYSLKERKFIEKQLTSKRSHKNLNKSSQRSFYQKQNNFRLFKPLTQVKTLQISHQVSLKFQPEQKSVHTQTNSSFINIPSLKAFSNAPFFQEENLKSVQELQLCGAQSIVLLSHMGLKKQNSNQSTECKCYTGQNGSIILVNKQKMGSRQLLKQRKSQKSLFDFIEQTNKPYTSAVMPGKFKISKISQQDSDKSQSLRDVNIYSQKIEFQKIEKQEFQKKSQNSSTMGMNNSVAQSFKSKMLSKQNLNDMQIRSTKSIKQQESVDEFSQVLEKSWLSSSSKKINSSELVPSFKIYQKN